MQKTFLVSILLLIAHSAWCQNKFTVSGKLNKIDPNAKVFITYIENGSHKADTVVSAHGEFSFSGNITIPTRATLEVKTTRPTKNLTPTERMALQDYQVFFLDKGAITITGDNAKTAVIKGGIAQADFTRLNVSLKPIKDEQAILMEKWMQVWNNADTTGKHALGVKSNELSLALSKGEEDFVRANSNSFVSLSLLQDRANYIVPAKFAPLYNGLSASLKNTEAGKALGARLDIVTKTSIGNAAINFTQNTPENKPFALSSLKGKYVLIDFWASWCGPCRAETPYLIEAYNTFKGRNFEIVSISLDEKRDAWLSIIKKDGMPWIHVSDLKGVHNQVAVAYGIQAIPRNFLLDPNGIIIAKNLRGDEVMKKLKELIQK